MNNRDFRCGWIASRGLLSLTTAILALQTQAFELEDGEFSAVVDESVRSGRITRLVVTTEPVSMLVLDELLLAGKFNPGESHPQAQAMVAPAEGHAFVLLTFEIQRGLSLGRYDYQLEVAEESHPIKAIGVSGQPFDPRVWEIIAESNIEEALALFEIALPRAPTSGRLRARLPSTIRERTAVVPMGREKPAAGDRKAEDENATSETIEEVGDDSGEPPEPLDEPAPVGEPAVEEPPPGARAAPPPPARKAPGTSDLDDIW